MLTDRDIQLFKGQSTKPIDYGMPSWNYYRPYTEKTGMAKYLSKPKKLESNRRSFLEKGGSGLGRSIFKESQL
jgi:hypothetical protein